MLNKLLNIFRKKDKRSIPLTHVHTFKTGEKLYTYNPKYYGKIASRYYKAITVSLNYIRLFGQEEKTVKASLEQAKQCGKDIATGKNVEENGFKIVTIMEFLLSFIMNKTALELEHQKLLFCIFYLLEEEIEGGYSDVFNEKKLDLISKDETQRDIFFSSVQAIAKDSGIILERITEEMILEMAQISKTSQQEIQKILKEIGF